MQELILIPDEIQDFIARAQSGDRVAFDRLVSEYGARLESWIQTRMGERLRSSVDVEDILQETHLRAFESLRRFTWKHEDSFFQWLSTIARHLIWNVSQRRSTDDASLKIDLPTSGVSPSKAMRRDERPAPRASAQRPAAGGA